MNSLVKQTIKNVYSDISNKVSLSEYTLGCLENLVIDSRYTPEISEIIVNAAFNSERQLSIIHAVYKNTHHESATKVELLEMSMDDKQKLIKDVLIFQSVLLIEPRYNALMNEVVISQFVGSIKSNQAHLLEYIERQKDELMYLAGDIDFLRLSIAYNNWSEFMNSTLYYKLSL